jgi:hypothetical protein
LEHGQQRLLSRLLGGHTHMLHPTSPLLPPLQGALPLQPGCDQGPMASYEPIPLSAVLAARKEGNPLGPPPRDDVGIVLRDMGAGAWRGLLVRKLGSTEGFWYDESVLLPASQDDVAKQVARRGPAYVPPRNVQVREQAQQRWPVRVMMHSVMCQILHIWLEKSSLSLLLVYRSLNLHDFWPLVCVSRC